MVDIADSDGLRAWLEGEPAEVLPPGHPQDDLYDHYTTNAQESLNRSLRKIIKTRGSVLSDEAAAKLLFLAIRNAGVRWRRPIDWIGR